MLLSIGDRVEVGTYRVHSRFARAVNYVDGRRLLTLVDSDVGPGPLNIVCDALAGAPDRLSIGRNCIRGEGWNCPRAGVRVYSSEVPRWNDIGPKTRRNLDDLGRILRADAPVESLAFLIARRRAPADRASARAFRERVEKAVELLFAGGQHTVRGVRLLHGAGPGLTPSGDDFLAGVMVGLNILPGAGGPRRNEEPGRDGRLQLLRSIYGALLGGGVLTRHLLHLARLGAVPSSMKALIVALGAGTRMEVESAARRVLAIGATSGADWITGLLMTLSTGRRDFQIASTYCTETLP